ncbi:MAG: GNAT family N-acetyltransferase, partial [Cyanobacteria bacterium]|nr:GNAT family N-acetyltransferase [Cyanobacteriota bacterium]
EMISSLYEHEELPCDRFTMRKNVDKLIQQSDLGEVLIIRNGVSVIGYAIIVYFYSLELGGLSALLDEFFIKESCRSQGFGNIAMTELFDLCRQKGLAAVQLEVLNQNAHAKSLYLKKGFTVRDRSLMVRSFDSDESQLRKAS